MRLVGVVTFLTIARWQRHRIDAFGSIPERTCVIWTDVGLLSNHATMKINIDVCPEATRCFPHCRFSSAIALPGRECVCVGRSGRRAQSPV